MIDIRQQAAGCWVSIFNLLGIDNQYFSGKHGPCPLCGGKDRWRWNHSTEFGHCNQCGSKGPVDIAIYWLGKPFKDTVHEIRTIIGQTKMTQIHVYKSEELEKNRALLKRIHSGLSTIKGASCVSLYLKKRSLNLRSEIKNVYASESMSYYEDGKKVGDYHAMVSAFRDINGNLASYHVTYIDDQFKKANVKAPKKIMPSVMPLPGCSIQLFNPVSGVLGVAEGIETALAVHELEGVPMWASGNAQLMESMVIPDDVKELNVYADADANFRGQKAAYVLANRYADKIKTRVHFISGLDWVTDIGDGGDFLEYHQRESLGISHQS